MLYAFSHLFFTQVIKKIGDKKNPEYFKHYGELFKTTLRYIKNKSVLAYSKNQT